MNDGAHDDDSSDDGLAFENVNASLSWMPRASSSDRRGSESFMVAVVEQQYNNKNNGIGGGHPS